VPPDLAPLAGMRRLASLYLDDNRLKSLAGLEPIRGLSSLSLKRNNLTAIEALVSHKHLVYLFLEDNKVRDLSPLIRSAQQDVEGEKRFAPFLNLYLKGNPVKGAQKSRLKDLGVRVND
jgi:Leucine-rich repeat (LRR) protein